MSESLPNDQPAQLEQLYDDMRPRHLYPLWEVLSALVTPAPCSPAQVAKWSYGDVRQFLMRAGDLISAAQAERRVLILENPGLQGTSGITPRLYAGLQMILPGEIAPCHRHSQSALRFVLEGEGAYTAVDGERAYMSPFDLVLTPNGRWHEHGNDTARPMIWLDGLDIPLVRHLDASFAEHPDGEVAPQHGAPGGNRARYGRNMRPMRAMAPEEAEPRELLFHYPYVEWSAALEAVAAHDVPDPHVGHALEFINPVTGGAIMSTISAHVQLLPSGFVTGIRRSTESAVYVVVEGDGEAEISGEIIGLQPRDILVVPSWQPVRWRASNKLVLFSYSDRIVQEKLHLYREAHE